MSEQRAQAFDKDRAAHPFGGQAPVDPALGGGHDPRPALFQAWELSGMPAADPVDPDAPRPGDAARAQSAEWSRAFEAERSPAARDPATHGPVVVRHPALSMGHVDPALRQAAGNGPPMPDAAHAPANAAAPAARGRPDAETTPAGSAPTRSISSASAPAVGSPLPSETSDAELRGAATAPDVGAAPASAARRSPTTADAAAPAAQTPVAQPAHGAAETQGAAPTPESGGAPITDPRATTPTAETPAAPAADVDAAPAAVVDTTPAADVDAAPAADLDAAPAAEVEAAPEVDTEAAPAAEVDAATPAAEPDAAAPETQAAPPPAAAASVDAVGEGGHATGVPGGGGGGDGGTTVSAEAGLAEPPPIAEAPVDALGDERLEDEEEGDDVAAELAAIGAHVPEPALGGGGGGGAAITPAPTPEAPDVSQAEPEAGLAQLSGLRPDVLAGALGGVGQAVGETVADKRAALADAPPTRETRGDGEAPRAEPAAEIEAPAAQTSDAPDVPAPAPAPTPEPTGAVPADSATAPAVQGGGEGGTLSEAETRQMASSIANLPTRDPSAVARVGPAPSVPTAGNADPARAKRDRAELGRRVDTSAADARRAAAQPMGEDAITITEPAQTLTAEAPQSAGEAAIEAPPLPGPDMAEAVGLIAGQQQGEQIDAALATARADMAAERQAHAETEEKTRAAADAEITSLEEQSATEQDREKTAAQAEVGRLRGEWQAEVDQQTEAARVEADAKVDEGLQQVEAEQKKGEDEAAKAHADGEREAEDERTKGEAEAEKLKGDGEKESSGLFGWIASKAKAFFDRIKKGISAALAKARQLVKAAIDKAKKLAADAIERARKAIVGAIQLVGKALIAIGDTLLAGFPALRDKFRASIEERVQQATDAVNAAAKALNDKVQKALDGLGKTLDAALGLLEKGLCFIVDGVSAMVQGAIKAAEGFVNGIAGFAALIKDIAAGPGQWIGNLGAAVVDGIQNHLWGAFKEAVKGWFGAKMLEVLGIGGMVIQTLIEGGFDKDSITQTVWEGLKAAIPVALITILVEKLVSMIVPAAGAVIAIIEGLQAAWGTVSRIIAAFAAFMAFLKLVRSGNAGPAFAQALAAGAVVVLDFVSNWLIKKIRKAAKAIGKKLKAIAQKIMRKLKRKKGGPKNNKSTPKDKDKDDKSADGKAVRREAKRAARHGWSKAKAKAGKRVMTKAEVEQVLRGAEGTRGGVKVALDAKVSGKSWSVVAKASKKGKTATASEGRGWVARDARGGTWLTVDNLESVNRGVIRKAFDTLRTQAKADTRGKKSLSDQYQARKRDASTAEAKGQKTLDQRVKGLRLRIEMEPFSGVDQDQRIKTHVVVAPNISEDTQDILLGGNPQFEVVKAPFSMGPHRHTLYLREKNGALEISMASQELPLTSRWRQTYTEIDNWQKYLQSCDGLSPKVKRQVEAKLNHISKIKETQYGGFTRIYEETFGSRRSEGSGNVEAGKRALKALQERAEGEAQRLAAWAQQAGLEDMDRDAIQARVKTIAEQVYRDALDDRRQRVDGILARFSTQNGERIHYRGSLAQGRKGPHKGGVRFDPGSFDLDLYVVDSALHDELLRMDPRLARFPNAPIPASKAPANHGVRGLQSRVVAALEAPDAVPGLRVGENYILIRRSPP